MRVATVAPRARRGAVTLEAIAADLQRLLHEQAETRRAVETLLRRAGPRDDAERRVLAAIAVAVGDRAFTSAELLAHGRVDPALAEAIEAADVDLDSPRACGKLLARLERETSGGLRLTRVDTDRDGSIIWQVSRV